MAIRLHLRGRVNRSARAARDMALVSVMADAGLRRSEAAALLWSDIAGPEPDGSGRVTIRRSYKPYNPAFRPCRLTKTLLYTSSMRGRTTFHLNAYKQCNSICSGAPSRAGSRRSPKPPSSGRATPAASAWRSA